ncbi:MAG TPA: hypothetical protein VHF92_08330 [Geodermatophilus sp.]|nr:hypothetical protein [Geodermatophilus sp.]
MLPEEVATPLEWIAYSWLGVVLYLVLALLALEPVRLIVGVLQRRRAPAPEPARAQERADAVPSGALAVAHRAEATAHRQEGTSPDRGAVHADDSVTAAGRRPEDDRVMDPSRRLFLARSLAATAGAVALAAASTGAYFANAAPLVQRVPITLEGLDPALTQRRGGTRSPRRWPPAAPAAVMWSLCPWVRTIAVTRHPPAASTIGAASCGASITRTS